MYCHEPVSVLKINGVYIHDDEIDDPCFVCAVLFYLDVDGVRTGLPYKYEQQLQATKRGFTSR